MRSDRSRPLLGVGFGLLLTFSPAAALAGASTVPAYSDVDSALLVCPAGDLPFHVTARIGPGIPAFRVFEIDVDVTDCVGLRLSGHQTRPGCSFYTIDGRSYVAQSCNVGLGASEFTLHGGGARTGVSIPVRESHEFLVLRTRVTFLSPDQNGDLVVDEGDMSVIAAKRGTADPTADFDFDGDVDDADLQLARAHLGHADSSALPVSAAATSWGRLKLLYRP